MQNVSGFPQPMSSASGSADFMPSDPYLQIHPPPVNPFIQATIHVELDDKPTIDLTLSLRSSVAHLRNLACTQWNYPQSLHTKCRLTFQNRIITAQPARHLATWGLTHNCTVKATFAFGSGGAPKVIKTITKDTRVAQLKTSLRMNTFKSVMEQKAGEVVPESRVVPQVKFVEDKMSEFLTKVETSACQALNAQAMKLDVDALKAFQTALNQDGAGNAEYKLAKNAHLFLGKEVVQLRFYVETFQNVLSSAEAMLSYTWLKATQENSKFSMKAFNTMLSTIITIKEAQASSASSSSTPPIPTEADVAALANQMGNMKTD
jgi:hypothetical protein